MAPFDQVAIEWAAWVDAKDLKPGYELLNPDDTWAEVVSVSKVDTPLTAYNLTVDEFSTFFVAANDDAEPVWVHNTCHVPVRQYKVGQAAQLQRRSLNDGLDIHHAGQAHAMEQVVPNYDRRSAPAIAIPQIEHRGLETRRGTVTSSARDILAADIRDLRANTNAPNASLQALIELNRTMYPQSFSRGR